MRSTRALLAGVLVLALAFTPGLADARAGGGGSFGSRGGMTYSAPPSTSTAPYSARPMQRSMTPYAQPYGQPSSPFYQGRRSSFGSGLLGGLIGAGIGGMLFGGGFFGHGMGLFGLLGLLLQIALIVAVVRFLFRSVLAKRFSMPSGSPNLFMRGGLPGSGSSPRSGPSGNPNPPPIAISPADYGQFEQLLKGIQAAWTAHDVNGLQGMATPEMVSYFAEQLSEQVSRGVRNQVADVRLLQGDLAQAWVEGSREYATVAMRFSMIDVTRDGSGRVVDGSPNEHVTATEVWTFVRSRGGRWLLSAIQQAR